MKTLPFTSNADVNNLETIIDALKWEPAVLVTSWNLVPTSKQEELMALTLGDPNSEEVLAIFRTANAKSPILVSWAEVGTGPKSEVVAFAIFNAWRGSVSSTGAIMAFLRQDYNNKRVHEVICQKLLSQAQDPAWLDVVQPGMEIAVSERDSLLSTLVLKNGFTPNPVLE